MIWIHLPRSWVECLDIGDILLLLLSPLQLPASCMPGSLSATYSYPLVALPSSNIVLVTNTEGVEKKVFHIHTVDTSRQDCSGGRHQHKFCAWDLPRWCNLPTNRNINIGARCLAWSLRGLISQQPHGGSPPQVLERNVIQIYRQRTNTTENKTRQKNLSAGCW